MSTDVYVLLTDTGTVLTKIIRQFTRDPLNHASISFDCHLNEVYSFGRKNQSNPFFAGFVRENVRGQIFEDSLCALYRCTLTEGEYKNLRKQIIHFEQNQHRYKYNLIGMLGVLLKIEINREYSYFCSQFVASVFEKSGVLLVDKSPSFVKPGDLQHTPRLELVYQGKLSSYFSFSMQVQDDSETVQFA